MPNPTPTIEMVLARPGEVDWTPPRGQPAPLPPGPPEEIDLPTLEARVGFHVLTLQLPGVHGIASYWLPDLREYFGSVSPGAQTLYFHESQDRTFQIVQRQVLSSDHPMMFIYGDLVNARQVTINGGLATVVIPLFDGAYRFVVWVSGDIFIWVTFFWPASEETMLEVVGSLA